MHRLIGLCLLTLIVAACGQSGETNPDEASRLIAEGVKATLTAASVAQAIESGVRATLVALQPASVATVILEMPVEQTPTRLSAPTPTQAVTPTASPTTPPTASPEATPIQGPEVMTSSAVNLRAGPGTDYRIVAVTTANDAYPVTGTNNDGSWIEVCCYRETPVWVAASVVTPRGNWDSVVIAREIPTVSPTLPSTPAPSSVSQLPLPPPPDWVEYQHRNGLFAFHHPPSWQEGVPQSDSAQFAILEPYQYFTVRLYLEDRWRGKTDAQIQGTLLESGRTVASAGGSVFSLISQSRLPTSTRTNAIQYTLDRGSRKSRWIQMIVILPDESAAIAVTASSRSGDLVPMTDVEARIIADSFLKP